MTGGIMMNTGTNEKIIINVSLFSKGIKKVIIPIPMSK
jgi:hypothetical protein